MFLSVVIPTKNRAAMLDDLLESIKNQTLAPDKFEVIIVDNGSDDKTKVVWESYQEQIQNLSYVFENQPGLHRGRHAGLRAATGDFLVFAYRCEGKMRLDAGDIDFPFDGIFDFCGLAFPVF